MTVLLLLSLLAFVVPEARRINYVEGRGQAHSGASGVGIGSYNETSAKFFGRMSQISFCDADKVISWSCGEPCEQAGFTPDEVHFLHEGSSHGVQGYVALLPADFRGLPSLAHHWFRDSRRCIASFRGSSNLANWRADGMLWMVPWPRRDEEPSCEGCKVHAGFAHAYAELQEDFRNIVNEVLKCEEIHIAGHSLGAAVGTLAAADLRADPSIRERKVIVAPAWLFGAPHVGNSAFRDQFVRNIAANEQPGTWRVVNKYDTVPRLGELGTGVRIPYVHIGPEIFYDKDGTFNICEDPDNRSCRLRVNKAELLWNFAPENHCLYIGLNFEGKHFPSQCIARREDGNGSFGARTLGGMQNYANNALGRMQNYTSNALGGIQNHAGNAFGGMQNRASTVRQRFRNLLQGNSSRQGRE